MDGTPPTTTDLPSRYRPDVVEAKLANAAGHPIGSTGYVLRSALLHLRAELDRAVGFFGGDDPLCPCCLGDPLTACSECLRHSCWAGNVMCGDARGAGTVQLDEKVIEQDGELTRLRAQLDQATARAAAVQPVVEAAGKLWAQGWPARYADWRAFVQPLRDLDAVPVDERVGLMLGLAAAAEAWIGQMPTEVWRRAALSPETAHLVEAVEAWRGGA